MEEEELTPLVLDVVTAKAEEILQRTTVTKTKVDHIMTVVKLKSWRTALEKKKSVLRR